MKTRQKLTALIPILSIAIAGCQKFQAAQIPQVQALGSPSASGVQAASARVGKIWALASKVCAKSGKNLMEWTMPNAATKIASTETLVFTDTTFVLTSKLTSDDSKLSASGTTTLNYKIKQDEHNTTVMEATVAALDFKDLGEKLGVVPTLKVGDVQVFSYAETASGITLIGAADSMCEEPTDKVVRTYN